jgi:gamma-glutamyl hercynylcysteine S-oxide synthase
MTVEALADARERTLALVAPFSADDLERVTTPLMSPLVWDLGHIAAYEDLWLCHRHGGMELLRPELAELYDAFETPRSERGDIPLLATAEAMAYLSAVRDRALSVADDAGDILELVVRHELQHHETMRQAMALAGFGEQRPPADGDLTGLERVTIASGPCTIGANGHGFAYDNEQPRHQTDVREFQIGRAPITNATYLTFVEGGGYRRREWWSAEAWHWKEEYDISHPQGWTSELDPGAPVVHVSWFEAAAFARAHGARLPREQEWEKAATSDQVLDHTGAVWEWTETEFTGYPGFVAHPYREYSEVFFDRGYYVLRGGSWASAAYATPTFRNWDLPQRRQIFSGLRLAWDV